MKFHPFRREPRRLHAEDMQLIFRRIDKMEANISAALDSLADVVNARIADFSEIEQELRDAKSLDDGQSTEIADRISAITAKLRDGTGTLTPASGGDAPAAPAAPPAPPAA